MKKITTVRLAVLAMMAALVFVSNYLRITIPINIGGNTSFTLANIMCCLSGLLLGPVGALASGLGSMLFDLTDPRFVSECWITFLTKGAMGLGAGLVMCSVQKRSQAGYLRCLLGAILGCAVYYALYFTKSYFYNGLLVEGLQPEMALLTLAAKVPPPSSTASSPSPPRRPCASPSAGLWTAPTCPCNRRLPQAPPAQGA